MASFHPEEVFRRLDRELWLVTARHGSRRGGLIATFVIPASIAPSAPRVIVGLSRRHHTRELVEGSGAFALHLLGEEHLPWVWRFGLESGRDRDKLEGLAAAEGATGSPILGSDRGLLECRVESRMDTGDRTIYLAAVVGGESGKDGPLLTEKRLLELAPADRRARLAELLLEDGAADGEAIRAFRERKGIHF